MKSPEFPTTASEIARFLSATVHGNEAAVVDRVTPLDGAGVGALTFCASRRFRPALRKAQGAVVLVSEELLQSDARVTFVVVANPQEAFARVVKRYSVRASEEGVSPRAHIDPTARLAPGVSVGPFAVVGPNTVVGRGSRLGPHVVLGAGVEIGEDCELFARVTVLDQVRLGNRVRIFPGTVLGADGFGFFPDAGGNLVSMPQVGTVVVEDDVRIGANCTVDRATLGATRIGRGTKLDDQVHVAHNVTIGRDCILCGGAAVAGSATLEDRVVLGGQVGIGDGVRIGAGASLGGQSGTGVDLEGGRRYWYTPAVPVEEGHRSHRYWRRLPEMWKRLRSLEARLGVPEVEDSSGGDRT
jgi:UDP-3-O-[3-hydroxymyristoyl] glucosamine N-acyltransferase